MTNPDTPTAPEALVAAWQIVKSPCSAAETERAKVLLGIARELREERQFRVVDERRRRLDRQHANSKLEALGVPRSSLLDPEPQQPDAGAAERTRVMLAEAPIDASKWAASLAAAETQVVADPGTTQRLPVVWSVGDRADCRHCHTPIEVVAPDPIRGHEGLKMWQHRYTGQATCADVTMGPVEGGFPGHTFAEPEARG